MQFAIIKSFLKIVFFATHMYVTIMYYLVTAPVSKHFFSHLFIRFNSYLYYDAMCFSKIITFLQYDQPNTFAWGNSMSYKRFGLLCFTLWTSAKCHQTEGNDINVLCHLEIEETECD